MVDFTLVRVQVGSERLAGLLDAVPGVVAAADVAALAEGPEPPRDTPGETPPPSTPVPSHGAPGAAVETAAESDGGLKHKLLGLWQDWGLLGLGVSMAVLGLAMVGLWLHRHRNSATSEPPTAEMDAEPVDEWRPDDPADRRVGAAESPESGPETAETEDAQISGTAEPPADVTTGSTADSDDESTVTAVDSSVFEGADDESTATTAASPTVGESDGSAGESAPARAPVDVAPLLGMGFLAVVGALVRWVQGEAAETG